MQNEHADILITHGHLLTMQGDGVGYMADGALAIGGNRILAVGATSVLQTRFDADETIDATGHAVMPGLIDAHMH
ncbi:MAG: amidohydrolase, partial [Caldilineaceae bacterium]|nr:amidohydrolase [Caldilineaceae bacterium]